MPDILDDYRQWAAEQPQHLSTHSDRCHLRPRHESCMIHRLAGELERALGRADILRSDLSVAMLAAARNGNLAAVEALQRACRPNTIHTNPERDAVEIAAAAMQAAADELGLSQADCERMAATLRGLLE